MTLHQFHLVCFAAGSVIHGVQAVLVWELWRHTTGKNRSEAQEGIAVCSLAFLWQFGNLWRELAITAASPDSAVQQQVGFAIQTLALMGFPLLFSYMLSPPCVGSGIARFSRLAGRILRYPLWIWTPTVMLSLLLTYIGKQPFIDPDVARPVTLYTMLFYFMLFFITGIAGDRAVMKAESAPLHRANRAAMLASLLGVVTFLVMLVLPAGRGPYGGWLELAAMMTSVPFTIAIAYRFYQFPFMDTFLRHVLTGVTLLTLFCFGYSVAPDSADIRPLSMAVIAIGLAFAKGPVARWVDRRFLGYAESFEEQEERIASAIRGLTPLDKFGARLSELLASELGADWVRLGAEPQSGAVIDLKVPGSTPLFLSIGPRQGARSYMSRQLQIARSASLELASQHERLQREETERRQLVQEHELRELTARAQVRALQAQINPHFLFNTLNVLASLIHSDPKKAERVTEDLAGIFRYALESTRLEWVRLDDEIRFIQSYLEIEQTRFEDRLSFSFDVDVSVRSMQIPPMILQPLVENAIRHGIGPKLEGGHVIVRAEAPGQQIRVVVEDNGQGLHHGGRSGSGVGLANVRERLAHIYGKSAILRLEEMASGGTRVSVVLPQRVEVHA